MYFSVNTSYKTNMKRRAIYRKIVAVICVMALSFGLIDTMGFVAKATEETASTYIPVTLADLTDNYEAGSANNAYVKFTKSQNLTWENTEFEGMFKFDFTGTNEANVLILGSTSASRGLKIFINNNNQLQIRLIDNGNAGKARFVDKYITTTDLDVESLKTELKVRVKFDFANVNANTADVTATVQVNDCSVTVSQTAFQLDYMKRVAWLVGTANYPLYHDSKFETTYVKLSDLTDNYQAGEVTDRTGTYTKCKDKNWNHTEFEGKFKFDFTGNNEENMLILGSATAGRGLKVFINANNQLQLRLIDNGNASGTARYVDKFITTTDLGVESLKEELNLKVNFDFVNVDGTANTADVTVKVQVNDYTVTLSQTAFQLDYMKRVAWLLGKAGYPLYHNSQYVEVPKEYEVVKLSDLTDNYVPGSSTNAYTKYTKCESVNWDGVQFEGKFKFDFGGTNEANVLILGSTSASRGLKIFINNNNQLQIRLIDNGNAGGQARFVDKFITTTDLDVEDLKTELELKITFDFSKVNATANTADVEINVQINDYVVTLTQTAFQLDYMKRVAWLVGTTNNPLYHNSQYVEVPKEYEVVKLSDLTDNYVAGSSTNAYTKYTKCESMNWDGVQFEGKFKFDFTGTNEANMLALGNTTKGGLKIFINNNNQLQIRLLDYANAGGKARFVDKFITTTDLDVEDLKTELELKITFDFSKVNATANTADVEINAQVNDYVVTLTQTAFQLDYMKRVAWLVGTANNPLYHNSQYVEAPKEYEIIHLSDLTDDYKAGNATNAYTKYTKCESLNWGGIQFEGEFKFDFTGTNEANMLVLGNTTKGGLKIFINNNNQLQIRLLDYANAGGKARFVDKLVTVEDLGKTSLREKLSLKVTFDFANIDEAANIADVEVNVYINDYTVTLSQNAFQLEYMKRVAWLVGTTAYPLYHNSGSETEGPENIGPAPVINSKFQKINFDYYEIESGTYRYAEKRLSTKGQMELENLNQVIFTDTVNFSDTPGAWICMGGVSTAWQGLNIVSVAEGRLQLKAATGNPFEPILFDSETAGTKLTGEDIAMMLSFEYVDADKDGKKNDVKLAVWFNGKAYENRYYYLKDFADQLGSYMGVYIANEEASLTIKTKDYSTLGSAGPKPTLDNSFTKVNFDSYWIKSGTYTYADRRLSAKGQMELENLDRVIFSDTVKFSDAPGACICLGGVNTAWEGLNILSIAEGELQLKAATGNPFTPITFKSKYAGVDLTGQDIEMTLSFEYVDSDKDGKKDDVKLGVWFNGKCYRNRWYYLKDFAKQLGNHMGIYIPNKETTLTVKTYKEPGDFYEFGFTENWRAELRLK